MATEDLLIYLLLPQSDPYDRVVHYVMQLVRPHTAEIVHDHWLTIVRTKHAYLCAFHIILAHLNVSSQTVPALYELTKELIRSRLRDLSRTTAVASTSSSHPTHRRWQSRIVIPKGRHWFDSSNISNVPVVRNTVCMINSALS